MVEVCRRQYHHHLLVVSYILLQKMLLLREANVRRLSNIIVKTLARALIRTSGNDQATTPKSAPSNPYGAITRRAQTNSMEYGPSAAPRD